jgi:hypothetical protein
MVSPAAQDVVSRALSASKPFERMLVAESLGRSEGTAGAAAARQALASAVRSDDVRFRAAAMTALGDLREANSFQSLAEGLDDPAWTVRSAAVRGLRILGDERAVPLLAARMRKEDGRLVDDLTEALAELTGKRLGPDPDGYERTRNPDLPPTDWAAPRPSFETPLFATRSKRVLFVLSVSETMKDAIHAGAPDRSVTDAIAAAGADLAKDLAAAKSKLDLARVHLRVMLRTLRDGIEFDVMTYAGSATFAFGEMTRADDSARRRAEARIAKLTPGGQPNLRDAFHRILDPRAKDPLAAPDGPDLVVLLTDGALPTEGFTDRTELGPREARWNRARQVRFVLVSVGQAELGATGRLAGGPPPGLSLSIP